MRTTQKIWFWLLQLIGWGFPAFINGWGKYISNATFNKNYIIAEATLFFVLGVFCSTLLRNYLKKHISFDRFLTKDFIKTLVSYVVVALLFSVLSIVLSYFLYQWYHEKRLEVTQLMVIYVFLNMYLFLFFWLIFYISIKFFLGIKQNRIERLQLETSLKESQLNTLKGQINPHFMFNSLNNIRGLMLEDVEKSREMITRLSEMLRYSLSKSATDKITLQEELEMVENYIALSKIQFEDRLAFESIVDDMLLKEEIPPMIIQMLVENAVKHGISNQKKGGKVTVQILKKNDELFIQVSNTGKIHATKESTKVGLKNIQNRLTLLYGNKAHFSLIDRDNEVVANIKIPMA
jgi:two-component system LytT family sensor kinase